MSIQRPQVSVFNTKTGDVAREVPMPDVFQAPIRPDIVQRMTKFLRFNLRQPHGVSPYAGQQHSAESWGTGRAVSRIPRVSGGGTHRAGQGAFGNMCRKGRMFIPKKTWRRWMHKIKKNERRYATASAIAASSISPLVQARGHAVDQVKQLPLVVTDDVCQIVKTKDVVKFMRIHGLLPDLRRCRKKKGLRAGKGKMRGRRHKVTRGPLFIFKDAPSPGITLAVRNIQGVEAISVDRLNLLNLAPGGHMGRLIVWTESAFQALHDKFGSYNHEKGQSQLRMRSGAVFHLPRPVMNNTDTSFIANSDAVQNVLRPKILNVQKIKKRRQVRKPNAVRNLRERAKLNPYEIQKRRKILLKQQQKSQ